MISCGSPPRQGKDFGRLITLWLNRCNGDIQCLSSRRQFFCGGGSLVNADEADDFK
jgi:hypothetical protein